MDTTEAASLSIGTPVLFRGVEVGTVTGASLGNMADRVQIALRISKKYQHLVHNNSVFWLASGYNLEFGLIGGVVKTGTFQQFIRGGIQFATVPLVPQAGANKHFLLQDEAPKEWRNWARRFRRQTETTGSLRTARLTLRPLLRTSVPEPDTALHFALNLLVR